MWLLLKGDSSRSSRPKGSTGEERRGHLGNSTVLSSNVMWPLSPANNLLVLTFALDCL